MVSLDSGVDIAEVYGVAARFGPHDCREQLGELLTSGHA